MTIFIIWKSWVISYDLCKNKEACVYSPSLKPLTAEGLPKSSFFLFFFLLNKFGHFFFFQCIYQYSCNFSSMNFHPLQEHIHFQHPQHLTANYSIIQLWAMWRTSTSIMAIYIQGYSPQQSRRMASIIWFVMSVAWEFERSSFGGNRSGCSKLFLEIICSSPASINNSLPA